MNLVRKLHPRGAIKLHYPVILFILIYFLILAYKLITGPVPFYDWDESLYIQTGKEMYNNNYFLFPVWQGKPWLDKPPLVPFIYATVAKFFFIVPPEVSTRIFTLTLTAIVLFFVYFLGYRASRDKLVSLLSVVITSFTPIFLQRAQVINLDVFLLLGWLGYLLFFEHFFVSLLFLGLAVMSKSLIGFYPSFIMLAFYSYLFFIKKMSLKKYKSVVTRIILQAGILALWFIAMLIMYGERFWTMHIIESHFRRVTASIESHFGKRTFYLDLAVEQLGFFVWFAAGSTIYLITRFFKKKLDVLILLYSLYLAPWFLFLNLTKTKIFWYFYAAIPQFAYLTAYPLSLIKKNKVAYIGLGGLFIAVIFAKAVTADKLLSKKYSDFSPTYKLSLYAKERCPTLHVLIDPDGRTMFDTLEKLGLLITTTKWWGQHPQVVYYFEKPVTFVYDKELLSEAIASENICFIVDDKDIDVSFTVPSVLLKNVDSLSLYQSLPKIR